nr:MULTISPECIES: transposase [unclassified Coprococcus]
MVIGIDVGSETHYARAFDYRGIEYSKKPFSFSNSEAGFEMFKAWISDIKEKHEKDKVVPGMEPTGHYWFNLGKYLQDNEMKPVLVNPHHVKKTKELDDNNPTKNDRKDPKVIAGLVKEGRYMIPYLPEGVYADLRTASNMRFQIQSELTRIQNRISRWLRTVRESTKDRQRLRYLLFEVAMSLVAKNPEFRELHNYYTTRRLNPLKKMQSLMAISAKLIRVFYAMLTKGVEYDPKKMVSDIKRPAAYLQAA